MAPTLLDFHLCLGEGEEIVKVYEMVILIAIWCFFFALDASYAFDFAVEFF